MNSIHIALAIFLEGLVTLHTDWLFMGDWLYKRYDQNPEIWRYFRGQGRPLRGRPRYLLSLALLVRSCAFICASSLTVQRSGWH